MGQLIKVGIGEMNVCCAPDSIQTLGLGSCVGVVLYDPNLLICGMMHIMLPDSSLVPNCDRMGKCADSAFPMMFEMLAQKGVVKSCLLAKIAGGARMFNITSNSEMLKVGEKNIEAVKYQLRRFGILLTAEDCGGECARTIRFFPESSQLEIKAGGKTTII